MRIESDTIDTNTWPSPFQLTVGTSKQVLSSTIKNTSRGISLKADSANTGVIYVGKVDVTTSSGYPLGQNEVILLPIDNPSLVYVIGSASGQKLYVICL